MEIIQALRLTATPATIKIMLQRQIRTMRQWGWRRHVRIAIQQQTLQHRHLITRQHHSH